LIDEMHALGVFHLDLHQRRNLVLDEEGMLCVIDFGAAVVPSAPVRFALGWLLRWIDRHAAVRLLARFTPDLLSRAEARHMLFYGVVRRLWPFTSHRRLGEQGAKKRLQTLRSERPRAG
jgi:serine/threonine protein kinase